PSWVVNVFLAFPVVTCYQDIIRITELTSQSAREVPPLSSAQSTEFSKKTARADRCEEILEAATKLFAEHGYADTDTQLLADKLHVGKGTLYRYFPSKRELFLAAADRGMCKLCEYIDTQVADIQDPPERIAQVVRSYLTFFALHPELCELLIHER